MFVFWKNESNEVVAIPSEKLNYVHLIDCRISIGYESMEIPDNDCIYECCDFPLFNVVDINYDSAEIAESIMAEFFESMKKKCGAFMF